MTKAEIQFIRSLSDKRVRDAEHLFIAEGDKLVEEIRNSKFPIRCIYTTRQDIKGANVEQIDKREMERISQLKTATDTLAVVEQPRHRLEIEPKALMLALDGVQNPGNLGTIIRLADWFGIKDIVCSKECAVIIQRLCRPLWAQFFVCVSTMLRSLPTFCVRQRVKVCLSMALSFRVRISTPPILKIQVL